jgi:hypothetical protein
VSNRYGDELVMPALEVDAFIATVTPRRLPF